MGKLSSIMDVGKRSMMNSQSAMQTVSHNIASKDVEGFSRQRVEFQTNEPTGVGKLRIGTGAKPTAVTRVNNVFMEKQIQAETGRLGTSRGRAENMARVEDTFNEQQAKRLNQFVTEFFNAFRELANNPESQATRDYVKANALTVINDFQRINRQLKDVQSDIDQQMVAEITEINAITEEIARLNVQVTNVELSGSVANDERDRRDALLKQLGEKINIRYSEGKNGSVNVVAGSNALLVSGFEAAKLSAVATPETQTKREGSYDIYFTFGESGMPSAVTEQITGGTLGGMLSVRDEVINGLLSKMDDLAFSMAEAVNTVHTAGYDGYGRQAEAFFITDGTVKNASENLRVNENIINDSWKIAAAASPGSPADNRIANVLSSLQYERIMNNGTSTFDDFYNGTVGELAVSIRKANMEVEHQEAVVKQLKNLRESISGVNLDEEAIKMIEYQKAFNASAKLIQTSEEMFDTILNLKR